MATIKLNKPAGAARPDADRAPVRGASAGVKRRPTLAQAQAERVERESRYRERYEEQLRQRYGDRPPPRDLARRSEGSPFDAPTRPANATQNETQRRVDEARRAREQQAHEPAQPERARPRPNERGARAPKRDDMRSEPRQQQRQEQRQEQRQDPRPEQRPAPRPSSRQPGPRSEWRPPADPRGRRHADADDDRDDEPPEHAAGSMRLSKRMSELGMASRREADEWIAKGWVRVDSQVVSELGSRVVPGQHITIDAKARYQQAQRVTVLINKPVGYVSGQAEDGYEPAVVLVTPENQWREDRSGTRFLREHLRSLVPAGRLDIDSVGLLVLTQDGRVAKQLIGEDSAIEKEYLVRVESGSTERLPDSGLALLRHGLELDGEALQPAHVEWVNDDQLRFVLTEGKKRQIRRMCEAVGLKVTGLKRVRIGQVMLGDLPAGQWRYLRMDESFG